ncbi:MAG: glycosyltransferase [Rhodobacteraceae bacterium]|nr:glycosyltransferase [Paracoccaceae bacterium]
MKPKQLSFCMIICSRRRPELITQALTAIKNLVIPASVDFSVLVVENDTAPQYETIIAKFRDELTIHYEIEAVPGLTHVRNHGLSSAEKLGVDWIGSIDDDIIIPEDWLMHMVAAIGTYDDTQMFYGNWIRHNHPDEPKWHPKAKHWNASPTGHIIRIASFNNIAVKADVFSQDGMALRFDHQFRFTGGEDTDFARTYTKQGGIIRSVQEALAEEYNSMERADFSERLRRETSVQYSCVKLRHKHNIAISAYFWSIQTVYRGLVLGVVNIVIGGLALPFNRLWGLTRYGAGRQFFAGVRGVLRYYFGSDPELYRDEDG